MNNQTSESQTRIEEHQIAMAAKCMERSSPIMQAEMIAQHYVGHAHLARTILQLIEDRNLIADTTMIDELIEEMVRMIKINHAHSLGIKLQWPRFSTTFDEAAGVPQEIWDSITKP